MGVVVPFTATAAQRKHKHHPFNLPVPKAIVWPPWQYVVNPDTKKPERKRGQPWWERLINWFVQFTPAEQGDVASLATATMKHFRDVGNIIEEDIRAAYESNRKYSDEIVQYVQAIGRIVEADLIGHARDIQALKHDLAKDVTRLEAKITANNKAMITRINKARAYAISKAVADSRAYVVKNWAKKIDASYGWLKDRDRWFEDKVTKWWKIIYKRQIRPIKTQTNNSSTQIGLLWATINVEVRPTLKLVAKAGSWLKWFAHWKRDALLAFGVLKAGEVADWLEQQYVKSSGSL